ncbi:protein MpMYBL3 [Marchantia polymorpha subsp. ruderalis]|uniref:Uncharacterized protein n=2 Tax=Marchantia polymorpha TaxID=3197 RepID=A0AAF6BWQ2_MARPO|nr:hypothetical protein MARPO_0057s0043 [Marchantia polymorpha]BBN16436.1 hypothetical protein Mp_7g06280 [Marchantia polymorpha subsp. ruderalis]|eukprot:PTQ37406.1 hypothetical protein MARPO_0057s0043 [Marchantia polymorpha]
MECRCTFKRTGSTSQLKSSGDETEPNVGSFIDKRNLEHARRAPPFPPAGGFKIVEFVERSIWYKDLATGELHSLDSVIGMDSQKEIKAAAAADPKQEEIMACTLSKPSETNPLESRKLRKSKKNRQSDHDLSIQTPAAAGGRIASNVDDALVANHSRSGAESSEPMKSKRSRKKHHDSPGGDGGGGGEDTRTPADNGRLGDPESRDLTCAMDTKRCKQQQCRDDRGASAHATDGVVGEIVSRFEARVSSFTEAKKSKKNHTSGYGERSALADAQVTELSDDQDVEARSWLPSEKPLDSLKAKMPKKSGSSSCKREQAHDRNTDCQSSAAAAAASADDNDDDDDDEIMQDVIDTSSLVKVKKLKKLKKKPSPLSPHQADGIKDFNAAAAAAPDLGVLSRTLDYAPSAVESSKTPKRKQSKSSIAAGLVQFGEDARRCISSEAADGTLVPRSQTCSPAKPKKPKKHRPATGVEASIIDLDDEVQVLESPVPLSSRTPEKEACRSRSAMKHSSVPSAAAIGCNFDGGGMSKAPRDSSRASQSKKSERKCRDDGGRGSEIVDEGKVLAVAGGGTFSSMATKPKTAEASDHRAKNEIVASGGIELIDLDDHAFDHFSSPCKMPRKLRKRRKHEYDEEDDGGGQADTISAELEAASPSRSPPHAAAARLDSSGSRTLSKKERKKLKRIGGLDVEPQAGQIVPLGRRDLIHVREDAADADTELLLEEAEENGARAQEVRFLTSRKKLKGNKRRQRSGDERECASEFHGGDLSPLQICNPSAPKKVKKKKRVRFLLPEGEIVAPEDEETRKRSWSYDHNTPDLHFGKFTAQEDEAIKTAVDGYIEERGWDKVKGLEMLLNTSCYKEARGAWLSIANCLPHRPVKQINSRARRLLEGGKRGKWLEVELQQLRTLFLEHGPDWKTIGSKLDRPAQVCKVKWRSLRQAPVKTDCDRGLCKHPGPWTQEERDQLQSYVLLNLESRRVLPEHDEVGRSRWRRTEINWEQVADQMNRRGGACAEVWYKKIYPFLFEGGFISEHEPARHLKSALKRP